MAVVEILHSIYNQQFTLLFYTYESIFRTHYYVLIARSQWRQWGFKGKPSKTTARYQRFLTPLPGPNFTIPVSCRHALLADLGPAAARAFTQISQVTRTPTLAQLNLHGQVSANDHADDFADICGPKPPQHLCFFMGNIQGLTVHQFWSVGRFWLQIQSYELETRNIENGNAKIRSKCETMVKMMMSDRA